MEHEIISEVLGHIANNNINKITFSNIRNKELELDKVIGKLVSIKNSINLQLEYRYKRIIKHTNLATTDSSNIENTIKELFELTKDINVVTIDENINIKISKKFKISVSRKKTATKTISFEHNKKKDYFLDEKQKYPFLIELGIQNKDGKVIKSKYNKFKQINKYLEFIKQATTQLDSNKQITILDFGSGKSYLTFSTYYYLTDVLNMNVKIIGIDLKKEIIEHCNNIAEKLNFSNLSFIYGDVIDYENKDEIDMVINLGLFLSGRTAKVLDEIALLKQETADKVLKVIIETCYLNDDQKRLAAQICVDAGADFVKTSTGFGTGGATLADVQLIKEVVGDRAKIKASGGIRNRETALQYIDLGVSRIGASAILV